MVKSVPFVVYTRWHEKFISFIVRCLLKNGSRSESSSLSLMNMLIFGAVIVFGSTISLEYDAKRTMVLTTAFVATMYVLSTKDISAVLTKFHPWETIHTVDNNFYETKNGNDLQYKATPIEDIHYSRGRWRTVSTDHIVRFRGINLPAKLPLGGNNEKDFYSTKASVSFIDKPLPLDSCHEHFQRLSNYGYNLIRLTVTWEAVMHEGPGLIDQEYLKYISNLVDKAAAFGLYIIIDPHQDVWSRFTGGDGAPWWTLDAAGFVTVDASLHDTGCAFLNHLQKRDEMADPQNKARTKMKWATNYGKLATATMFTLFFAGDEFAPGIVVDEGDYVSSTTTTAKNVEPATIQNFLQKYYFQFIEAVAEAVKDKPNVIGFESMNEPSMGYIGVDDLKTRTVSGPFGYMLNHFDGMRLGSGESLCCEHYSSPFYLHGKKILNPDGISAWKSPNHDIWRKLGVYSVTPSGERILNKPDYFQFEGDYTTRFMLPWLEKLQLILTKQNRRFVLYADPPIDLMNHKYSDAPSALDSNKYAWAPHWYDVATLTILRYIKWFALDELTQAPVLFQHNISVMMKRNLGHVKGNTKLHVILGEVGVPFDMDLGGHNQSYTASTMALDRTMQAVEANDLDYVLWNYTADNTNDRGDNWNGEDLSLRTKTENRALLAAVRPFVKCIPFDLKIISQQFDPSRITKQYALKVQWKGVANTENAPHAVYIYLPHFHYFNPIISVSGSPKSTTRYDLSRQTLIWGNIVKEECEMVLSVSNQTTK